MLVIHATQVTVRVIIVIQTEEVCVKIRFCEHNKGKKIVYRRLKDEFPDISVKVKDCVKQCSACREMPMATVDGKRVTADDGDQLYQKIVLILRDSCVL
jgi:uncharacterized protein YuzB (UPF0349 family)